MLGIVLYALYVLTHLLFMIIGRYYDYYHFTNGETEVVRVKYHA